MSDDTNSNILKELSDIKSSLAVNTSETANIKKAIDEIRVDIKEIKNDYINRREFNERMKDIDSEMVLYKKIIWTLTSVTIVAIAGALFKLILK